jgi:LDH2 family malate/lactate/ureidoglycolate dehydrogenase
LNSLVSNAKIGGVDVDPNAIVRVPVADLQAVAVRALTRHGARVDEAAVQARHLIEGDMRHMPSHGVRRLGTLIRRMQVGLVNIAAHSTLNWERPAVVAVDGDNGFGPVVAYRALDALIERSAQTGVALAAIQHAHHLGMLSPYTERTAAQGAIGVVLTTSEALVHPWGGRGALVGTNPLSIGVPSSAGPVVLDMSTAAATAGAIIDHAARGARLPVGWAVDAEGRPTLDADEAIAGAISPFGGAKGFALGLTLEALVGLTTHAAYGVDVAGTLDHHRPVSKGDLLIVISLEALGADPNDLGLAGYLDIIRDSGIGGERVRIPGDRARAARAESAAIGVPLDPAVWAATIELAGA